MASLTFKGKTFVQNHHLAVKFHQLVPKKDKSLSKKVSLNDNLIIHGDNLIALKALLPIVGGKVKIVAIDPPYNKGTEHWVYNDNVNSPMMQEWFKKVVDRDDFTRHDKWLCMMMPRLKILKELMSRDGIIAVNIDDNEVFHLGKLMDEIFGEDNRLACAPWLAEPSGGKEKKGLRKGHGYVLIYHNGDDSNVSQEERSTGELDEKDKLGKFRKGRELSKWGAGSLREDRPDMWFPLRTPQGEEVYPIRNDGKEGRWRWGKKNPKIQAALENPDLLKWELRTFDDGVKYKGKSERWAPYEKIRDKKKSSGWSTWLDTYGFNADGTRLIKEIFGDKQFDTAKPLSLMEWLVSLHSDENAIVLDSFAGSGTTAHAVLSLNNDDEGNRRFILIECEEYADKITAERVRRVIKGVKKASDESLQKGLGGSFSFFELGNPIEMTSILEGKKLPNYIELARYIFYTATGEEFNPSKVKEKSGFIGESKDYEVYLFYKPDIEYLKSTALTLDMAKKLGEYKNKTRLVFAPSKYLDLNDSELIEAHGIKGIVYCQLPFEIYKLKG